LTDTDTEAEKSLEVMEEVSVALTETVPPAVTELWSRIEASTVLVVELVALAPLPAPLKENEPLPASDTAIAPASAWIWLLALALTEIAPTAVTVDGSMLARVVPPMSFSAKVTAMATDSAADPLAPIDAEAETTSEVMAALFVAVR